MSDKLQKFDKSLAGRKEGKIETSGLAFPKGAQTAKQRQTTAEPKTKGNGLKRNKPIAKRSGKRLEEQPLINAAYQRAIRRDRDLERGVCFDQYLLILYGVRELAESKYCDHILERADRPDLLYMDWNLIPCTERTNLLKKEGVIRANVIELPTAAGEPKKYLQIIAGGPESTIRGRVFVREVSGVNATPWEPGEWLD